MRAPDFWRHDGYQARLLDPVGRLFGLAGALRRRLATPKQVSVPVICIGNLTVGGAGKTPTALAIARRLQALGARPHFLTRGYGGRERGPLRVDPRHHDAETVGDEPLLLARSAPTWVSRDRAAGALAAVGEGADLIVMDDGLQNPHLEKDLRLLAIDGAVGFGNGRLMPAGPLRERIAPALRYIDAAIVIGPARSGLDGLLPPDLVTLSADLVSTSPQDFYGRRVLAFAGIGRPEKFYETLRGIGADLVETHAFADHYPYQTVDIEKILARARQFDAVCVTTEKDHVRLPPILGKHVEKLPIHLKFDDPERMDRLLSDCMMAHAAGAK